MRDPLTDLAGLEGVPSAVAAALASVDAVLRDRGLRTVTPETAAASLLRGARGNAALTVDPERWLPGAVRLAAELAELAGVVRVAPAQALARAHALAAQGLVPDDALGRVRVDPSTEARLAGLTTLLTGGTAASAVVLAAVVHAEIVTLRPFGSADDLVARSVEHAVLVAAGVDPRGLVPVEAGHAQEPAAYRSALVGYAAGSLAGVRGWLLHCARALGRGAEVSGLLEVRAPR